ncbi:MAG: xanthine dehydrogenase family protein molybdopterin-binding subunit [Hyphomicrobiaceae bacterium]|nr:xanthine dehydrogenase family protein molybdopterin-binding subunit [Hyphomicrobiaceae bacterium]
MTKPLSTESLESYPQIVQWVSFDADGCVRLRSGKVEIGQGIATALVQMAAEELDIAPERCRLIAGNTSESPDEGMTTSSKSVEVGGTTLRLAASAARHVLLAEAAKLLQAAPEQLSVSDGAILRDGEPTDITYWTLAPAVDLAVPVRDHAAPKAKSAHRLVGTSLPRLDMPVKLKGAGGFIQDLKLPGLLHARVLRPPSPSARLVSADFTGVETMPGVLGVVVDGSFVGIVAETEMQALAALARAGGMARWSNPPPAPADPIAAVAANDGAPQLVHDTGDVGSVAGTRISLTASRPHISHASIGLSCALAQWSDAGVTVLSSTQGVYPLRGALAMVLGIAPEQVTVVHVPGAGAYGHNGADDVALDAALLARAFRGRPVRVLWQREDEIASAPTGSAMVTTAEATIGADGRIAALSVDVASQPHGRRPGRSGGANLLAAEHLAKPFPPPPAEDIPPGRGGGADRNAVPLYRIPNVRVAKRIATHLPYRTSSLRGLGHYINIFALECLMDDVADALGQDPLALRLAHLEDARARHVLSRVAELAGWPGEAADDRALGLGFAQYKNRSAYCAVAAEVVLADDIRVPRAWAVVDAGEAINPDGIANQIEGGMVQALSWTLKEAVRFDGERITTRDWESYPILHFSEVPEITVEIVEADALRPLGVGEASLGPMAAAVGNAIKRASGVRLTALPLTRDGLAAAFV